MKKLIVVILGFIISSCQESSCDKESEPYWSGDFVSGKMHKTKIVGENITIRNAFKELRNTTKHIVPSEGFITLRLNLDESGILCEQEVFEIDTEYRPTSFNDGELSKQLMEVSSGLRGWSNQTNSKTYYLIRLKIKSGEIVEVF